MAAETVEKIADTVGKVAKEVDKATEDLAEALPEGGLKQVVSFVEDLAEEAAKDAQKVEDLMDKVHIYFLLHHAFRFYLFIYSILDSTSIPYLSFILLLFKCLNQIKWQ